MSRNIQEFLPGTRLDIRLDEDNNPKPGEEPINGIDAAALKHDIAYKSEDIRDRHVADVNLIHDLNNLKNLTTKEKLQRGLVKAAMKFKILVGGGVYLRKAKMIANQKILDLSDTDDEESIQVPSNDQLNLANELHKDYRKTTKFLKITVYSKDNTWGCDIADMVKKSTDNYRFILVCIDLYTRFGFCVPMINKTQESIREAFENIFEEHDRIPEYIWFDKEAGIKSNYFKRFLIENNIILYHTENQGKSVFAERFIRTLKNKMYKYFTAIGKQEWNKSLLDKIVDDYNNTVHSSINITPKEASDDPELVKLNNNNKSNFKKPKFQIGDRVRIFKWKNKFEKGFTTKWTDEIFIITRVNHTNPTTYEIIDLDNEKILGRFYENELQKTIF